MTLNKKNSKKPCARDNNDEDLLNGSAGALPNLSLTYATR